MVRLFGIGFQGLAAGTNGRSGRAVRLQCNMKGNRMSAVSFEEFTHLAGELLPERAVLSTFGFGGGFGGGHEGPIVVSSCVAASSAPTLVGPVATLVGAQSQQVTQICTPAAVIG
jgi:hypothetical protein